MAVTKLPLYPGARAREALSPSQQATLNSAIAGTLQQILELPKEKRDVSSSVAFVASYAKDHAQRTLHALIWDTNSDASGKPKPHRYTSKFSTTERNIHERTLKLSQIFANDLPLEALIDLAVVYGLTNPKRFRAVLLSVSNNAQLIKAVATEAAPAFMTILSSNAQGLYGLRKASYILLSFLHTAPPELVRPFARDREFVLSIGKAYDSGLTACARSYGGIRPEHITSQTPSAPPLDDWEKIFLETKVALIDSFHILIRTLLKDVEELKDAGPALAARCEAAFEVVFGLQDLPSPPLSSDTVPVPFLNQSLLSDYQHTYGLSRIIAEVTRRADDPRTELLESTLQSLDQGGVQESDRPGALKLLLRSSGAQPGIDNLGNGKAISISHQGDLDVKGKGKGKGKAAAPSLVVEDSKTDAAITQVLDIFPEQDPDYLRFLLVHQDYPYKGDAERLIGALLEGTVPSVDEVHGLMESGGHAAEESAVARVGEVDGKDEFAFTRERRNVFDEEAMDVSQLRVGKKKDDAQTVLQDRAYIEQMKADILRRAEEISDEEEDEDEGNGAKGKGIIVAFEDELDEGGLKVRDGEESSDGGSDDEGDDHDGEDAQPKTPETILELAYIADPKVFDRDVQTRRSKARQDLRTQTGWADEQIEGWRIMLERNPNKDKILQKHEFTGNRRGAILPPTGAPSHHPPGRGRGQGRGRGGGGGGGGGGRGRGRGRGRGVRGSGDGGEGGGGDSTARDRAYKDKNKARHANHNRKSGHDKKLARVAGPS